MFMSLLLTWLSLSTLLIVVLWNWFWGVWDFLSGFVELILAIMLTFASGFKLACGLGSPWTGEGGIPQGCPLGMVFMVALYLPWCRAMESSPGVRLQLYADKMGSPAALLNAAKFTNMYIRLVEARGGSQEVRFSWCL